MPNWRPVTMSSRIVAEAYLADTETILVRFPGGVEYYYRNCPLSTWQAFTTQSRGKFIDRVLDHKPKGRWFG